MISRRPAGVSERMYRALLHAHPADFRRRYGEEMSEMFRDALHDARSRADRGGVARVWLRALADLATSAAHGHLENVRRSTSPSVVARAPRTGDSMLSTLMQDLRFTLRTLRKSPVLTAAAVLVVALGAGAVSTIFSVANAIVLRPIPAVHEPRELAFVERSTPRGGTLSASHPYYEELARQTRTMSGIAALSLVHVVVGTDREGVESLGNIVSGNFFDVLGVRPQLGRFFAGDETRVQDAHPVAVISHAFWQRQFAGDSSIVGRDILVNGRPYSVIGITPPRFAGLFPVLRTDIWVPLAMQRHVRPGGDLDNPRSGWLQVFGRVKPGVSKDEANAEMSAISSRYATAMKGQEHEDWAEFTSARFFPVTGLPGEATGAVVGFFVVLLAVAGLVLLIAAVNVASMLLSRAVARRREISVRIALGAGRARLVRQLLTENVLLFLAGGALGMVFAVWGTKLVEQIELPVEMPMVIDLAPDTRALAFTLVVSLVTGVVFGVAPAMQATRLDVNAGLRGDSAGAGRSRSRLRSALIVGQVAASLVLLAASGLFVRALEKGRRVDPGFDVTNVATTSINLRPLGYDEARGRQFYAELKSRLAGLPGVEAVGYARILPLSMSNQGWSISVPGYAPPNGQPGEEFSVQSLEADEGYLAAVRLPIVSGRGLRATDGPSSAPVAVVNRAFADRIWPGQDPIGRTFVLDSQEVAVVGVTSATKFSRLDEDSGPFVYVPNEQRFSLGANLVVRTTGDAAELATAIRREISALDPKLPAPTLTTLERTAKVALLPQRVAVAVTAVLGLVGLLLAAVGLYGALAFSAAQRTREIGVRMALGARAADVLRLVVGEGMRLVAVGMGLGLALALLATQALRPFLFGVSPVDPLTFGAIGIVLGGAALLASWLPARKAAKVDPASSLRQS